MSDPTSSETPEQPPEPPKWRSLSPRQRRVIGVLVEKAKTTPDAYPMTVNAIRTGCNQKSNRSPQMNLTEGEIEDTLEELREIKAVGEVQGSGRALKYRHYMYDWLGVDKFEIAVMTELLLRGEQTIGELRGRAARMEPIAGVAELKPILKSLMEKNLLKSLTPEGRGQMVTHNLYKDRELESLTARFGSVAAELETDGAEDAPAPSVAVQQSPPPPPAEPTITVAQFEQLQNEVAELRSEVEQLTGRLDELMS